MKKAYQYIIILLATINMGACDYFAWFDFNIVNDTDDSLTVAYVEQMQSFTTIYYTPGHTGDFQSIHLEDYLTDTVIPPRATFKLSYDAGLADRGFADQLEDPKEWGIIPLWERIGYMIQKGDTLDSEIYAQDQWKGKGSTYTLTIRK
ncbi:MAG: hypothetical protein IKO12_07750 [Bacteroidaceae bacterium]|nr:hypothetical protein [Bacteroidaceae bacterium]